MSSAFLPIKSMTKLIILIVVTIVSAGLLLPVPGRAEPLDLGLIGVNELLQQSSKWTILDARPLDEWKQLTGK